METSKSYISKAKEFVYIAWAIIGFSMLLILTKVDFSDKGSILFAVGATILTVAVGALFISYGNRTRKIVLTAKGVEYYNPKLDFSVPYDKIILLKSFQDIKKTTSELVILTEDQSYTVASTFFKKEILVECFRDLCAKAKDYPEIVIEDDRLWLDTVD